MHGYHPFAEDAEIYLPGVEKILHPSLFPMVQEFFRSHASLTLFPNLIAFSLRVTHLPYGVWVASLACGVDLSAAAGLLGIERTVFPERSERGGAESV